MTPERIYALLARFAQPVTLQRVTGTTTQVRHEVACQAVVRGYEPHELISGSGIVQGDRSVVISNTEIARAQWPGPPRANDKCVIDGRQTNIQACDTRRLRNEIVLHLIQVRGVIAPDSGEHPMDLQRWITVNELARPAGLFW